METPPVFETATSKLHYSNDGRLEVEYRPGRIPRKVIDARYVVVLDGTEDVLCTQNRLLADAYIAGYDLAKDAPLPPSRVIFGSAA